MSYCECSENCIENSARTRPLAEYCALNGVSDTVEARQYLQFGNLVFDGKRTVEAFSTTFRNTMQAFLRKNGSVSQDCEMFTEATTLSLTIEFAFCDMTPSEKQGYCAFIKRELMGTRRLWAIDTGGLLIYTFAKLSSYSESIEKPENAKSVSVEFQIPSGVWYIADLSKVYALPYIRELNGQGTCAEVCDAQNCKNPKHDCRNLADKFDESNLLCNNQVSLYFECQANYQLFYYDNSLMLDLSAYRYALTRNTGAGIAGYICSDTILPTPVAVVLLGKFKNPVIQIGCTSIGIEGDYDGTLRINADGDVSYESGIGCGGIMQEIDFDKVTWNSDHLELLSGLNDIAVTGASDMYTYDCEHPNPKDSRMLLLDFEEVTF